MRRIVGFSVVALVATFFCSAVPASAGELDVLKAQVEMLMQRIEALEAQANQTVEAPDIIEAEVAGEIDDSGESNVSLTVSGQVNRAALYVDDGDDSRLFHVDNDNSSTRVRFVGEGQFNDDLTVGTVFEVQFESNSSADVDMDQTSSASPNNFTRRHLELYFDSEAFGRLWVGRGNTASQGTSQVDLSGTTVVGFSNVSLTAGGISFKDSATAAKLTTINDVHSNFNGMGRRDRLRYDTPEFSGLMVSTSAIEDDAWDVALRYSANFQDVGTRFAAAVAYAHGTDSNEFDQFNGSISALHDSGLNFTVTAGVRDPDGGAMSDAFSYYGKLGYLIEPFSFGKTALAVEYGITEDLEMDGDKFTVLGAHAVQYIDKIGTEVYAGYRNHALDRTGVSVDDVNTAMVGARVRF